MVSEGIIVHFVKASLTGIAPACDPRLGFGSLPGCVRVDTCDVDSTGFQYFGFMGNCQWGYVTLGGKIQ